MTIIIYILTILLGITVFFIIKNKRYKDVPLISGIIFVFFIGCALISLISLFVPYGELLIMPLGGIVFGLVFILAAFNDFYSLKRCSAQVEGIYRGYNTYYGGNGVSSQAPMFEYTFNGTHYHEQTAQTMSYKHLTQNMQNCQTYTIYVDPNHPAVFVVQKKIKFSSIIALALGMLFFVGGIVALWTMLPMLLNLIQSGI
ncbi:MAG: hypothetical protein Q4A59_06845 [Erysipelotrichaceae bacterium]|nr:hypothetical protein [Erysipelotrichaceae bacterium]